MPFIITVSDSSAAKGSVFERVGNRVTERPANGSFVAACNAAQGTAFETTRLDQILSKSRAGDLTSIQRVLADPEVMMECNIYCVVFDFQQNRLWLASGEVPAAKGSYRQYPLFRSTTVQSSGNGG